MPDFGGGTTVLQDAYVDLRFTPAVKIRAGKFKTPVRPRTAGLGNRPAVRRACVADRASRRTATLGVLLFGDVLKSTVNYTVGVVNGVVDGASADTDDRDGKDAVARMFALPLQRRAAHERLRGLGVGIAGTSGTQRGTLGRAKPARLPDQRSDSYSPATGWTRTADGTTVADGAHWRVSPQGYYYTGPFGVLAEYVFSSQRVRRAAETARLGTRPGRWRRPMC